MEVLTGLDELANRLRLEDAKRGGYAVPLCWSDVSEPTRDYWREKASHSPDRHCFPFTQVNHEHSVSLPASG